MLRHEGNHPKEHQGPLAWALRQSAILHPKELGMGKWRGSQRVLGPIFSHQTLQDAFLESRLPGENSTVGTVVPGHLQSQGPSPLHCMQDLILSSWEMHLIDIFSIVSPQSCRNPWRSIKIYVSHFG